jgi:hypothetical protein
MVSVTDTYGRILCFLDRSRTKLSGPRSKTLYFSENLVALGIEPEPLDL